MTLTSMTSCAFDRIEKLKHNLGAQLSQKMIGGVNCWTMSSKQYLNKAAVANIETAFLDALGQQLPSKCMTVVQSNLRPELDATAELNLEGMRYYHELIGILHWAIELGRIDISTEVAIYAFNSPWFATRGTTFIRLTKFLAGS